MLCRLRTQDTQRILFACDFDWSLVEVRASHASVPGLHFSMMHTPTKLRHGRQENSDTFILRELGAWSAFERLQVRVSTMCAVYNHMT